MDMKRMMGGRPRIAVIEPNTLAVLGIFYKTYFL